jgi:hypothetical protein
MGDKNLQLIRSFPDSFDYQVLEEEVSKTGKMFLKGILQKADTLNQNGRVYPKDILEREVRNYQKFIVENRATGECVPPGTEIYTRDGWKQIQDISEDEVIFTLNLNTNDVELQRITQKVVLPFEGDLLRFRNHHTYDMVVTPNHRVLMWNQKNEPTTMLSSELVEKFESGDSNISSYNFRGAADDVFQVGDMMLEKIPYKGDVFCVTVPNGTWLMRYNGKVCWTHNCDHPDSSVISLKNVSHIIREAYFEGDNVVGRLEVLDKLPMGKILRGLIESNVKVGISSRGVGSTVQQGDYQVVQSDFQLICFDAVQEPSTPGAFILPEGRVRVVSKDDLNKFLTKSDRLNRILTDILDPRS